MNLQSREIGNYRVQEEKYFRKIGMNSLKRKWYDNIGKVGGTPWTIVYS